MDALFERFHRKLDQTATYFIRSLMEHIAELTHLHDEMHTVTGAIAILLMFVHALWAIWTYVKGTPIEKRHFNRFSIVVWCIWLIPYLIGVYLGMRLHV